jgi:hypothetical protein
MTNTMAHTAGPGTDTEWAVLDAPGSSSFGTGKRGEALDVDSNYSRFAHRAIPGALGDSEDGTTGTDRSFSFDISNNRLLASVDDEGFVFRLAISSGLVPVYETGLPGVFVDKDHDYVEGSFGIRIEAAQGKHAGQSTTDLIDNLIPRSRSKIGALELTTVAFAPLTSDRSSSRQVVLVMRVKNAGEATESLTARIESITTSSKGGVRPKLVGAEGFPVEADTVTVDLLAGETRVFAAILEFDRAEHGEVVVSDGSLAANLLAATLNALRSRYGTLSIPDDPYYADFFGRAAELARQVMLFDDDGAHAGSFWGSDPNDRADVWMLDLYYSMLPMAQLNPALCRATVDFFVQFGLPPAAWANYAAMDEGHPLPGVEPVSHSVANATGAIALAGAYLSATGDSASLIEDAAFMSHATSVIDLMLSSRPKNDVLFPSVFISDGPSRGDFHTGSNIKAWYALITVAKLLESAGQMERATALLVEATNVKAAIYELCQGEAAFGPEFFEGTYRDGSHVAGHDGEESDLTLASFYGFSDIDESRVINHALSAFSSDNPYFTPATGGISWWDFQFHGPTFPAYIHALSAASTEQQTLAAMQGIRERTDLDGSIWWWPHLHTETNSNTVLRGPGKCGWAAGVYVSKFIHDLLGLQTDAPARTLTFAPFLPWNSFEWSAAKLGSFDFDASYTRDESGVLASITNRSDTPIVVRFELLLPEGTSAESFKHNATDARETVRYGSKFGRGTVIAESEVHPGQSTDLRVGLVPFAAGHRHVTGL